MAPREQFVDGFKDLLRPRGAVESSLPACRPSAAALSSSGPVDDASDEHRTGEAAAVDDEREKARRILALCDLAEKGTSASLSSSVSVGGEPSPCARRASRGPEMLRRLSYGVGAGGVGDLLGSVLAADDDCQDTADNASSHSWAQHCSHCQSSDAELASLRATVEGLRSDLQRMAQRHNEDTAEMAKLRGEKEELSRRRGTADDESRRLREIVGDMKARENWLKGENERLRRRLEAGSSSMSDTVVELSDMAAPEDDDDLGEGREDEDEDGVGDGSAPPERYFNRTSYKAKALTR